jgi:ATP adenylyltransferase
MKKGSMNMHNARDKGQLARMQQLKNEKRCFFCENNYTDIGASPAVYESPFWYIKKNDYPYKGSVHHYLIVPKTHINSLSDISSKSWSALSKAIEWLEEKLKVKGYSIFARSGDMHYTGATIDHLHFHFLTGAKSSGPSKLKDNILVSLGYKKK